MKSVSASIYFLSQRFAHVALEKVIDDQHQEYNNSDDEAVAHPPATKRIGSGTLLRNFLSRSQSLNSRGHSTSREGKNHLIYIGSGPSQRWLLNTAEKYISFERIPCKAFEYFLLNG